MPVSMSDLMREVHACRACERLGIGFEGPAHGDRAYRFPPVIGATEGARVLFLGTNPRVSDSNRDLHNRVTGDYATYAALAANRVGGRPYIGLGCAEKHYRLHAQLVADVFPRTPFERVAAVSEVFFCASRDSKPLPQDSPCADRYLARVIEAVHPAVIVAVGAPASRALDAMGGGSATVQIGGVRVPWTHAMHPNAHGHKGPSWAAATTFVRQVLSGQPVR